MEAVETGSFSRFQNASSAQSRYSIKKIGSAFSKWELFPVCLFVVPETTFINSNSSKCLIKEQLKTNEQHISSFPLKHKTKSITLPCKGFMNRMRQSVSKGIFCAEPESELKMFQLVTFLINQLMKTKKPCSWPFFRNCKLNPDVLQILLVLET